MGVGTATPPELLTSIRDTPEIPTFEQLMQSRI
jgi:hypothetical protein